jgi:type II secretory pathway pseudopilin PulG
MAKLIHKKLPSASLIEVIIAMIIIMIVFAIAMRVFTNVMNTGVSFTKIQVQNQLNLLSKKVQQEGYLADEHLQIDSVDYFFEADSSSTPGLAKLSIKASQQKRVLGEIKCLFKPRKVED